MLPRDAAQVRLYAEADVVISPHGAHAVNAALMRPGATYIELAPYCVEMCTEGCLAEARAMAPAIDLPQGRACLLLLSMYGPLQQHSGVRYHVLPICAGGNRCVGGKTRATWTIHRADRASSTKYNWQADIPLDAALLTRIRAILDGVARGADDRWEGGAGDATAADAEASRVAPYQLNCSRLAAAGAWRSATGGVVDAPGASSVATAPAVSMSRSAPTSVIRPLKCTWASGCCKRHPKNAECMQEYERLSGQGLSTP